jgi:hypothetical protein
LSPDPESGENYFGTSGEFYFGIDTYGWEVFYHIPTAIAAGYAASGQFNEAQRWLQKIFDPHASDPWQVMPLIGAQDPDGNLAFDTGDVIVDPDRIARDYPFYYQQATIRTYLETLIEAGDAAYEQETQESLQRAKALYVAAKQLFQDNLSEVLERLSNTPWKDPMLGDTLGETYDGFLPPYNQELRVLFDTLEGRLHSLRHWLSLSGAPLDIPLLPAQVDRGALQRTAKAKLTLRGADEEEVNPALAYLDFPYIVGAVKGYINNLKLTSHRLQSASEKEGDSALTELQMQADIGKSKRAVGLQDFAIAAAEKDVQLKEVGLSTATLEMASHVAQILAKTAFASKDTATAASSGVKAGAMLISSVTTQVVGSVKATIPNTFGFSNGGQNLEQSETIAASLKTSRFLYMWDAGEKADKAKRSWDKVAEAAFKTGVLASKLGAATLELQKATKGLEKEKAMQAELQLQANGAQRKQDLYKVVFGGTTFYEPFREDLEALYVTEWNATQDLCRLLVDRFNADTRQQNGFSYIQTKSLSVDVAKFNAPHRLAVDIQRLETAYIQAMSDATNDPCSCTFALSELQAMGQEETSLQALATRGETYFELTEDMFDVFYPGQFDRRIQSVSIDFPGLGAAGLSPHARLSQVSNTCYLSPERGRAGAAQVRKNRHGLQSLTISGCQVDTRSLETPDGLLRRFQNTGTEAVWHLAIPALQVPCCSRAKRSTDQPWHGAAQKQVAALREHVSEVTFTVRFTGRWTH